MQGRLTCQNARHESVRMKKRSIPGRQTVRDGLPHRRNNVTLRMSDSEKHEAQCRADEYASGNLSVWLRYAGTRLVPNQADICFVPDKK